MADAKEKERKKVEEKEASVKKVRKHDHNEGQQTWLLYTSWHRAFQPKPAYKKKTACKKTRFTKNIVGASEVKGYGHTLELG